MVGGEDKPVPDEHAGIKVESQQADLKAFSTYHLRPTCESSTSTPGKNCEVGRGNSCCSLAAFKSAVTGRWSFVWKIALSKRVRTRKACACLLCQHTTRHTPTASCSFGSCC